MLITNQEIAKVVKHYADATSDPKTAADLRIFADYLDPPSNEAHLKAQPHVFKIIYDDNPKTLKFLLDKIKAQSND